MAKKLLKWQQEVVDFCEKASNDELFDATINLAGGDDYDGIFTSRGEYTYNKYYNELTKRLIRCKFLNDYEK